MNVTSILQIAKESHRNVLTEFESKQLLAELGLPVTVQELASTQEECIAAAEKISYPVAMKLMAEDIVHKSDAGAVKLNLQNDAMVAEAYEELMAIETSGEKSISVQEFAAKPICETIIGLITDPQFGPAIAFGLGGIFTEIFKDVAFRIAPITLFDAQEMVHEIRSFVLLDGYRGAPQADLDAIYDILLKISQFAIDYPEVDQLDLNPVFAYPEGAKIVDARIILRE